MRKSVRLETQAAFARLKKTGLGQQNRSHNKMMK